METSNTITAATLMAFLKCPTKARFLVLGDNSQETYFSDVVAGITSMYKSRAWRMLHDRGEMAEPANFRQIADSGDDGTANRWFDCDTAVCDLTFSQRRSAEHRTRKPTPDGRVVPVLFSPWEKPDASNSLLVCFGALSLLQATGTRMETGILVYGDNLRRKTVRISDHLARLNGIESVQLVHYGAYETRFLRTMKKRYVSEPHEVEFVDRLLTSSVNLVAYSRDNGH